MEQSPELRDVMMEWFGAVARGDAQWVRDHCSSSAQLRLIGTDPAEQFEGSAATEFLTTEASDLLKLASIDPGVPEAYVEGTVGWGLARPTIAFTDGPTVQPRWTGVFHLEDGLWKAVQVHASLGVGNDEAGFG